MTQLTHTNHANGSMPAERTLVENVFLVLGVMRRGWRFILVSLLVCGTMGAIHAARVKPVHKGTARLLIIQEGGRPLHAAVGNGHDPFQFGDPNDEIPTHMLIIRSPMLLERAIEQTKLAHLRVPAVAAVLKVTRPEPDVKMLDIGYQADSAEEAVTVVGAVVDSYTKFLKENYQKNTRDVIGLIDQVRDDLSHELKDLESKYLEFRKQHKELSVSEDGRSLLARRVDQWDVETNKAMLRSAHLKSQLELGTKLHGEGEGLHGIASVLKLLGGAAETEQKDGDGLSTDPALQVEAQLEAIGVKRATAERLLEHLKAESARVRAERPVSAKEVAEAFYDEPETARLVSQVGGLTARRDAYRRSVRSESDPAVREVERRLAALHSQLDALWNKRHAAIRAALERETTAEIEAEVHRAETELIVYRAQEAALTERRDQLSEKRTQAHASAAGEAADGTGAHAVASGPAGALLQTLRRGLEANERLRQDMHRRFEEDLAKAQETEIDRLTEANMRAELERQRRMFHSVVEQLKEARIVGYNTSITAQVVNPPSADTVRPKVAIVLLASVVLGLGVGFGLAFLYDMLDAQIRSLPEIRRALDMTVLGLIPQITRRDEPVAGNIAMISHDEPRSMIAESYKSIRTNLDFLRRSRQVQTLLVTSPHSGDGKSTSASNLAIALAHAGRKVLLVDADLRRPSQHLLYGLDRDVGLAQVLKTLLPISSVVQRTTVEHLDLMSAGPAVTNPSELLSSTQFTDFLDAVRAEYDMVIIDSSPLLAVTDPCIIGAVVDGIVLVVRATTIKRHDAERATELLHVLGTPIIGTIINGITREQAGYGQGYGGYGYGYGYGNGTTYGNGPVYGNGPAANANGESKAPQTLEPPPRAPRAEPVNGATSHEEA